MAIKYACLEQHPQLTDSSPPEVMEGGKTTTTHQNSVELCVYKGIESRENRSSLAKVEVDLVRMQEVADAAGCGYDAVAPRPLDWIDLTALVLTAWR